MLFVVTRSGRPEPEPEDCSISSLMVSLLPIRKCLGLLYALACASLWRYLKMKVKFENIAQKF